LVQFLSPEWMDELNQAAALDPELADIAKDVHLTLKQVVTRPGREEATYTLRIDGGRVEVAPGEAGTPDVTLSEDYATAAALAQGELTAQAALLSGLILVRGNTDALARGQQAMARAQLSFDRVRERTTY
jgi:putative sterol carrier protein